MVVGTDIDFTNLHLGAVGCLDLKTFPEDVFIACNQPAEVGKVKIQHHFTGVRVGDIVIVECRLIIKLDDIVRTPNPYAGRL